MIFEHAVFKQHGLTTDGSAMDTTKGSSEGIGSLRFHFVPLRERG
jgi:hypothetical protein